MAGILHALDQRRLIDSNGIADGASIYFHLTGTTTPATIYSDAALTTPLANPVVVAAGAAVPDIYLSDAVTYRRRIVYTDGGVDDSDPYTSPWATRAELAALSTGGGGTLILAHTDAPGIGVVFKGTDRFIHDYGTQNYFAGVLAGNFTTTAANTTAVGYLAGNALTSAQLSTFFGWHAGKSVTSGGVNTFVGSETGATCTTGSYNDGFGCKALANLETGHRNKAIGQSCFMRLIDGNDNVGVGQEVGINLLHGGYNVVIGSGGLNVAVSASDNTAIGGLTQYTSTASYNTSVGKSTLYSNTTGEYHTAAGVDAAYYNTTASGVTAIGAASLRSNNGAECTALGFRAGFGLGGNDASTVDTYCTFLGAYASRSSTVPTATVLTNSTAIGYGAQFNASNQVAIGNQSVTSIRLPNTATIGGTGAQTINKPAGSVNFAAAATSLVVTSSAVTANSIIVATVNTNDSTMKSVQAVAGAGSFTLYANAAPTADTRVSFLVIT